MKHPEASNSGKLITFQAWQAAERTVSLKGSHPEAVGKYHRIGSMVPEEEPWLEQHWDIKEARER